ncbi:SCO family protein [Telluria aromaticivorans]|uniref:SCO family protein n=1 Tax=Telluria aromaticivorans TaxID=2725995 RepID=A0A7Y2NZ62_9BURK|nr:SCO family protein [Telluria aromaticivorans]NNG23562.1 SCO family protein [Telluria aromaticivorans]
MNAKRSTLLTLLASAATSAVSATTVAWEAERRSADTFRGHYFTNASFVDHTGRHVKFYDNIIQDKVVVVNMMYTACTSVCPSNTANLLNVQRALGNRMGRDVHMVSLSLLPELDSPSALRAYMQRYGVGPGWTFLTGTRGNTDIVRRRLGFYDSDPAADADLFRHTGMVSIGNDKIDRWCMMPALTAADQIVRSIEEIA